MTIEELNKKVVDLEEGLRHAQIMISNMLSMISNTNTRVLQLSLKVNEETKED